MKKTAFVSMLLPLIALTTALLLALTVSVFLTSQRALAQSGSNASPNPTTQSQPALPPDQNAQPNDAGSVTTFSGKIVKSGSKLVLADLATSTTYQLDDQQKAQAFLNKSVKVTGVLDASTGTIRVSAIAPD